MGKWGEDLQNASAEKARGSSFQRKVVASSPPALRRRIGTTRSPAPANPLLDPRYGCVSKLESRDRRGPGSSHHFARASPRLRRGVGVRAGANDGASWQVLWNVRTLRFRPPAHRGKQAALRLSLSTTADLSLVSERGWERWRPPRRHRCAESRPLRVRGVKDGLGHHRCAGPALPLRARAPRD